MNSNQAFLATTALEDFWDVSGPTVFLSDGCCRYSRKDYWGKLNYTVLHSPLEDRALYYQAYAKVSAIYERVLPQISKSLNAIHRVLHNQRYWRITVGCWLWYFVHVLYERYTSVKSALEKFPDLTTVGLAQDSFEVPRDTAEFINSICFDKYNLQLYTMVFDFLGTKFPRRSYQLPSPTLVQGGRIRRWRGLLGIAGCWLGRRAKVWVRSAYFSSHAVEAALFFSSRGKAWVDFQNEPQTPAFQIDYSRRAELSTIIVEETEFDQLLAEFLPLCIPQIFIEGFSWAQEQVKRYYDFTPKTIISGIGWYPNEIFKFWSALQSEKKVKIIGVQHGANYGIARCMPNENHEIAISDLFFSWGWSKSDVVGRVKPMPAAKLMNKKVIGADNSRKGILLATNCFPRYFYRFQDFRNFDNEAYFLWQQKFMSALSPESRYMTRVRLFVDDKGCDCRQRWQDFDPRIHLEDWSITFDKSLEDCRIHVSDHLASTFVDGFVADKPTILFWDPHVFQIRAEAQPYFDELRAVGILHDSPEAAAACVDQVYADVEAWWHDPQRQAAVKKYCYRFARTSPNAFKEWLEEVNFLAGRGLRVTG